MILVQQEVGRTSIQRDLYNNIIYCKTDVDQTILNDLKQALRLYTNKNITVSDKFKNGQGIHLVEESFDPANGQSFKIEATGSCVKIYYTSTIPNDEGYNTSLANGVYYWLNKLGIEWVMAGGTDLDIHIPQVLDSFTCPLTTIHPLIRGRKDSNTGGTYATINAGFESFNGGNFDSHWASLRRRLRISEDYQTRSHNGHLLYQFDPAFWEAHPEYYISHEGKHLGRFKVEQEGAMTKFLEWGLSMYHAQAGKKFKVVGIDEADGSGKAGHDPLPPYDPGKSYWTSPMTGDRISTYGDKRAYKAKRLAMYFAGLGITDARIQYMSYGDGNSNAAAPQFTLPPMVEVLEIPHQFQTRYPTARAMYEDWQDKVSHPRTWTYLNYTQSTKGMMWFSPAILSTYLKEWKEFGMEGVAYETTASNIAMPLHYCMSKAAFGDYDVMTAWDRYFEITYGKAAQKIKTLFERWGSSHQTVGEAPFTLIELENAANEVERGSVEWRRILVLKAFARYMLLFYNYEGSQTGFNEMWEWIYKTNHLMIIQTPGFYFTDYIFPKHDLPDASGIIPLTEEEIEAQFQQDLANNPPLYTMLPQTFDINKAKFVTRDSLWSNFKAINTYNYCIPKGQSLSATLKSQESGNTVRVVVTSADGDIMADETVEYGQDKNISFNTVPGKYYSWVATGYGHELSMNCDEVLFTWPTTEDFWNESWIYTYIPDWLDEIVIQSHPHTIPLIAPAGEAAFAMTRVEGKERVYKASIPLDKRNRSWVIKFGGNNAVHKILNVSLPLSMQPFDYDPD